MDELSSKMDKINSATSRLNAAWANHDKDREARMEMIDDAEKELTERIDKLTKEKCEIAEENGNINAKGDDLVEINAGGKIIAAKRDTLTQLKGTRLEALFSGRWENKLQRDSNGRIFLDVNPKCFQAIVDYLNELMISSEDNPPRLPSVAEEYKHVLKHQLDLFGLSDKMPVMPVELPDSTIIINTRVPKCWTVCGLMKDCCIICILQLHFARRIPTEVK